MVYFGTGQYLTEADKSTTDTQAFYGIWDSGTSQLTQANLVQQGYEPGIAGNAVATDLPVNYAGTDKGWFINLPLTGERMVTTPILRDNVVFFVTLLPDSNPCSFGSRAFLMALDMATGGRTSAPAFDANGDQVVDAGDYIDSGGTNYSPSRDELPEGGGGADTTPLGDNLYTPNTSGGLTRTRIAPISGTRTGRLSWQELLILD